MSRPEDCKSFSDCNANLCPLDPDLKSRVWLPEESEHEDTCHSPEFSSMQFVRTQKKIARRVRRKNGDRDDYFTFEMLNRNITVGSRICGVSEPSESMSDSLKRYSDREKKWILAHPEKKQLSVEEIEKRAERMKAVRKAHLFTQSEEMTDSKGAIGSLDPNVSSNSMNLGGSEK